MGGADIEIALSARDAPYAIEAAKRINPDLAVRVSGNKVFVSGPTSATSVRHVWRLALLNERLVAEANARRTDILATLIA